MSSSKRTTPPFEDDSTPAKRPTTASPCTTPTKRLKTASPYDLAPIGLEPLNEKEKRIVAVLDPPFTCKVEDCTLPAAFRNRSFCPFHKKHFIPQKGRPGTLCLDFEFMPQPPGKTCCCQKDTCHNIGYPTKGHFKFPINESFQDEWCKALSIPKSRLRLVPNDRPRVAYWHFLTEHREYKTDGKWYLKKDLGHFKDNENKVWKCATPPVASLAEFVKTYEASARTRPSPTTRPSPRKQVAEEGAIVNQKAVQILRLRAANSTQENEIKDLRQKLTDQAYDRSRGVLASQETTRRDSQNMSHARCNFEERLAEKEFENTAVLAEKEVTVADRDATIKQLLSAEPEEERDATMKQLSSCLALLKVQQKEADTKKSEHEAHLASIAALKESLLVKDAELIHIKKENMELSARLDEVESELEAAKTAAKSLQQPLRYAHFIKGRMEKHTSAFFVFDKIMTVEKFLDTINIKKDELDAGMCTRLRRHSYGQRMQRDGFRVGEVEEEDARRLRGLASSTGRQGGRPRKLHWKDEFLMYSCYHYTDMTHKMIAALMEVSRKLVHEAVCAFADYLDMFFEKTMPNPTRQEIRRNYPEHFIRTFHHASIVMILDCTDVATEDPALKRAHSTLWSQYHQQTGAKFAVACAPIGTVPHSWLPEGRPSSCTDPNITMSTGIIRDNLQKGDMVSVDKGFLIENHCAAFGVRVMRPTTKRNHQAQYGVGDTEKTSAVGNTRIIIEQVNRQGKSEFRLWNRKFPLVSKDLLTQLMRIGFMFANFKPAFIIGRDGQL